MKKVSLASNEDGLARLWIILIVVVALLVTGGVGYTLGKTKAEDDAKAKYDAQTQALQEDVDEAKSLVGVGVEDIQQDVEALQAENTELKTTVDEQTAKIADLEHQLQEAEADDTTTTPPQQ